MPREVQFVFHCDGSGESYGHAGSTVYKADPTLPAGWQLVRKADGTIRRFCTTQEAIDWLNGTLEAPVLRDTQMRYRYVCDYDAGHTTYGAVAETEIFRLDDSSLPPGWMTVTKPDGAPGYYETQDHAMSTLNTSN